MIAQMSHPMTTVTMKSPFLIDICIISDKRLSTSEFTLSPLFPLPSISPPPTDHTGLMQVHPTAFPKMPPLHLLLQ